jgi:NDP-sugar pyrophosphorylase family protein
MFGRRSVFRFFYFFFLLPFSSFSQTQWVGMADVLCIVLAAGFGTRLRASLQNHAEFGHLIDTPKPLLPLGGHGTIAELWAKDFASISRHSVVVVSNGAHAEQYKTVFANDPRVKVIYL